jgi:hypothetical protein
MFFFATVKCEALIREQKTKNYMSNSRGERSEHSWRYETINFSSRVGTTFDTIYMIELRHVMAQKH